ncbi:Solute carrier family 5 member 4,Sodium/nucleoside cotransporter,Sodium/myo-inositol cotransporter,Sodium/glucose cotransporter 5,Solute carrier family 5 member 4A,Sodium/glucose cotransporter 4,Sodium/glucose cotransporter 2,Sodium/glucose cotransporter 1,Sodium/myo-inositol cotransporter 2 [Mytilus edulis]|uniref:Sodium/glucose cotransporter 4 n=1 Tax=Mytilus edulis TaxID=6550 RepID=A0A8S3QBX6_MYTED|nr:Solute carrier family 5 member 4,Sodium/nucleoside cotransporter,Sodium/myo-inositol cotransporter,Sodium/glucose cotransporter 5,Solute carrier family 5 member 4A,Sodium/glucose cotransporter 4,Sodium/glucose cotransporter 2,Sodium/glucose cotransporter 1,Sodium/myo-inositol cotransporter 2 [Mytilus edulis]
MNSFTSSIIVGFIEVGGYEAMIQKYFASFPDTTINNMGNSSYKYAKCGIPPDNAMHLFRSAEDGSLPWPGIMFGLTISAVWYWCSDQVIVQRALAAKNLSHAKAGTILAGYLKFLPLWIMVFPGMISRILYRDSVGCADPDVCEEACGSRAGCSNIAFPKLVLGIMPTGLKGLMLAVMMSALISSLTSIFNSSSTLFTIDIWLRIRNQASDVELMIVGSCSFYFTQDAVKIFTRLTKGSPSLPRIRKLEYLNNIFFLPIFIFAENISELFHYIQAITSFLAPPVCAIYVLAVFWKRTNEQGAFWGLMIGLVVGLTRFIWEYAYTVPPCGEEADDNRPDIISKVHYLHFGIILFGISFIATIIISLLTKPIPDKHLHRLTFWNRYSTEEREDLDAEPDRSSHHETKLDQFAEEDFDSLPCYTRAFRWICGIEKMEQAPHLSEEEKKAIEAKQNSIHETKTWRYILNINAVVLMTLAVFLWGFYA